MKHKTQKTTET